MTAPQNPFAGKLAKEYDFLAAICPGAVTLTRKLGDYVAGWREGPLTGLEIGCGDGRSTRVLLDARPNLELLAFDSSAKMLNEARVRLADDIDNGRLRLVEADALAFLRDRPDASADIIATNYVTHNFQNDYRSLVLAEVFRVLKPGGLFVNADRFAMDDPAAHLSATQADLRHWFKTFAAMGRYDLLEEWVVHLFSDESPQHIMCLTPALAQMRAAGFTAPRIEYRDGVDTLVTAIKT